MTSLPLAFAGSGFSPPSFLFLHKKSTSVTTIKPLLFPRLPLSLTVSSCLSAPLLHPISTKKQLSHFTTTVDHKTQATQIIRDWLSFNCAYTGIVTNKSNSALLGPSLGYYSVDFYRQPPSITSQHIRPITSRCLHNDRISCLLSSPPSVLKAPLSLLPLHINISQTSTPEIPRRLQLPQQLQQTQLPLLLLRHIIITSLNNNQLLPVSPSVHPETPPLAHHRHQHPLPTVPPFLFPDHLVDVEAIAAAKGSVM